MDVYGYSCILSWLACAVTLLRQFSRRLPSTPTLSPAFQFIWISQISQTYGCYCNSAPTVLDCGRHGSSLPVTKSSDFSDGEILKKMIQINSPARGSERADNDLSGLLTRLHFLVEISETKGDVGQIGKLSGKRGDHG